MRSRLESALYASDALSIGDKRNCFSALRNADTNIDPKSILIPLGVTVGELALAQVLHSADRNRASLQDRRKF